MGPEVPVKNYISVQTCIAHRLSCEDLHCSMFIFLKQFKPSGQGGIVGSEKQGSDHGFAGTVPTSCLLL